MRHPSPRHGANVQVDGPHAGPPNQGSEVVDNLAGVPGFRQINGPAGMQLGTTVSGIPKSLGPADFELGIIAGTRSINLILSLFLPNPDDGKVSVEDTKLAGMKEHLLVPVSHPFLMRDAGVIGCVVRFLGTGAFREPPAQRRDATPRQGVEHILG